MNLRHRYPYKLCTVIWPEWQSNKKNAARPGVILYHNEYGCFVAPCSTNDQDLDNAIPISSQQGAITKYGYIVMSEAKWKKHKHVRVIHELPGQLKMSILRWLREHTP
jgi:hypothetical protein